MQNSTGLHNKYAKELRTARTEICNHPDYDIEPYTQSMLDAMANIERLKKLMLKYRPEQPSRQNVSPIFRITD